MHQTIYMSRHFSKECSSKLQLCPELGDFYDSDQKVITTVAAILEKYFSHFQKNEKLATLLRLENRHMDLSEFNTPLFETAVVNDLQEYYLLAVLLRIESCTFDLQLVELVDSIIQNCQDLHSKLKDYIAECLGRKNLIPGFKGGLKDNVSIAHERHYAPYKEAFGKIVDENKTLLSKYQDYFNRVVDNDQITTYRIDFLSIMYESKVNVISVRKDRVSKMIKRFDRLDSVIPRQEKSDIPNTKNFASGLYLNAFHILPNHHYNEVELLKNEYFLKEADKAVVSLIALLNGDDRKAVADLVVGSHNHLIIQDSCREAVSPAVIDAYITFLDGLLLELMVLVDENPILLERFTNFGFEHERLFTVDNFIQTILERSMNPHEFQLSEHFREQWAAGSMDNQRNSAMIDELAESKLIDRASDLIKRYHAIIMKAMHSLNTNYEKHKSKFKDAHFFLRTAILLRQSTENFFSNQRSSTLCDKFSDYLLEENFTKNIDVVMKQDNDLRLGYLFNSAVYKNNLRYDFFGFLTKAELENSKTFRKVERVSFKENNPLYLVMSFKSMESNLHDLFAKFKDASFRDLGIIMHPEFGSDVEEIFTLVNENDEYAFFTSDKKHYDTKAPKTLMFFARHVPKTEIFDLVAIYISAIYDAICQCYSYCRNKKIQLARKFEAACVCTESGQAEVISLLDEVPQGTEQACILLAKVYEGLQRAFANTSMTAICEAFRKEYVAEYSRVLVNALIQGEPASTDSIQTPITIVMPSMTATDAVASRPKRKSQVVDESLPIRLE